MPKQFDDILAGIKKSLKGKKNPRTNKPYTDSDLYAIAQQAYKKKTGKAFKRSGESEEIVVAENVRVNFSGYAEVEENAD